MAPLLLFLLALGVRVLTAAILPDPAYPDSYYYVNVARELAAGNGLSVDYIWNFVEVGGRLPDVATLPIPSNAHWMPLAVLIQVPFIWLLGPTAVASGLPFWLVGAAVAPVAYWIARDASLERWQAIAAGVLVAIPGAVTPFLAQPDNFALFMLLGALSLWACARGLRGDRRAFALGGLLVGLAFLSRNDGVLLGVPFALAFLVELVRRPAEPRIGWRAALLCAGGFLLVASPWLLRQVAEFGSISPSAANGRILWITDYRQLYSIASETTLGSFLSQGIGSLLVSRISGLWSALLIFGTLPLLAFLVPFVLIGAWQRRRDAAFMPWIVYGLTLFAFSALLFAVHVPYGTFLHSAVALVPHAYIAALVGVSAAVGWVARRRPSWDAPRATRVFSWMVVGVVALGAVGGTFVTTRAWKHEQSRRQQLSIVLDDVATPGDRVMSADAGAFRYLDGRPGIVTPDDPLPVIEAAARAYGVRWLVLERDHLVPALRPVLLGETVPDWLVGPVFSMTIQAGDGATGVTGATGPAGSSGTGAAAPTTGSAGEPVMALYAVCFDATGDACSR